MGYADSHVSKSLIYTNTTNTYKAVGLRSDYISLFPGLNPGPQQVLCHSASFRGPRFEMFEADL